jgi:aspartate aminotransferase-like enzyme
MISTASPGDTIIVPNAGKFGERWVKVGKVYGLNVIELKDDWGNPTTPERIAEALKAHPEARYVVVPQTETSTAPCPTFRASPPSRATPRRS